MARNQERVKCKAGEWTELTNSNVAIGLTFEANDMPVDILYTVDPADPNVVGVANVGWTYMPGTGEKRLVMADFAGGGENRAWARPAFGAGEDAYVTVDHA